MIDLTKLSPAPWRYEINGERVLCPTVFGFDQHGAPSETDANFIALARNAFDGDPEALAWWEANRVRRDEAWK